MPQFCSDCGAKLSDENATFCTSCGASQAETPEVGKTYNWKSLVTGMAIGLTAILIGYYAILALYTIRIYSVLGSSYSIGEMRSLCSDSLMNEIGNSICSQNDAYFYIGWAFVALMMLGGVYILGFRTKL